MGRGTGRKSRPPPVIVARRTGPEGQYVDAAVGDYASTVTETDKTAKSSRWPTHAATTCTRRACWALPRCSPRTRRSWSGTLLLVFQPAEELGAGSQAMVDDGLYERSPRPTWCWATRGSVAGRKIAATQAVVRRFGLAAGAPRRQGRARIMPQNSVDPVVMAAATVLRLQTIVSREVPSTTPRCSRSGRSTPATQRTSFPARPSCS